MVEGVAILLLVVLEVQAVEAEVIMVLAVAQVAQVIRLLQAHPKVLQGEHVIVHQLVTALAVVALLLLEQLLQ